MEHSDGHFVYNMYIISKSCINLLNQYTQHSVNKFGKAGNDSFPARSLLFFL